MGFFGDRGRDDLGPPPEIFRVGSDRPFETPRGFRWLAAGAALLIAFLVLGVLRALYVDWLWFDSVGPDAERSYGSVFRTVVQYRVALFLLGALIAALGLGANIWLARRLAPRGIEESFAEIDPAAIRRLVSIALVAGALFLSVVFGSAAAGAWDTLLVWRNAASFGVEDPLFNRDISFYVFTLPAYQFFQGWILGLLIVSTLAVGAVYALTFSLQGFELNLTRPVRIHLSLLVGSILIVIALGTWLGTFNLVNAGGGIVYGATYTDVNARLPVRYVLAGLGLFAGLATIANAFMSEGYRLPQFALGIWALAGLVGGLIYPATVQTLQVEPNELERESTYIARNIEATRRAWGLDQIEESAFPAAPSVSLEEIRDNPETIENVRLLDPLPLRDTFNQIQSIRPLYIFNDIDVDRYTIDGEITQTMLSVRELDISRVQSPGWTRERLQLTHGFGAVVAPVSDVTPEGLPRLLTADIPPTGTEVPLTIEGARVYFGELTNHYVIVNTNEPEFDYPVGEGNAETRYEPDRGIRLSSIIERVALAWELADRNLLVSGQIGDGSRLLMHRNIRDRISMIAPFLRLDADPYPIILDGRLIWMQDAYTRTGAYPYSTPRGDTNYVRNSVKVTVDAITGDTVFYLMDDEPIAATWASIFPDLFTPVSEMPEALREHLRYPEEMFRLQSELYLRYHITDPRVFFVGEDIWAIPSEQRLGQEEPVQPYYVVMRLPGELQEEFALIMPFTPRNKQNTVAWLAGRADGENYGKLRGFRFPTDDLVFGPAQVEARIDQNPGISAQLSLWNQSGSGVIRGNLLMIPIGDSFLFVEPIYLQATNSRLPELVRVVVANGTSIAMEDTLERSIDVVFGLAQSTLPGTGPGAPPIPGLETPGGPAPTPVPTAAPPVTATPVIPAGSLQELLQNARGASEDAQADLDRLRAILDEIERRQGQAP